MLKINIQDKLMYKYLTRIIENPLFDNFDSFKIISKKIAKYEGSSSKVILHKSATYINSLIKSKFYLRNVTQVGKRVRTIEKPRIENFGTMIIGDDTVLRSINVPVELCTEPGATLSIGHNCSFNYGVSIGAVKLIEIGNRVRLGPYVMVIDSAFHTIYNRDIRPSPKPVFISDDVWVGAKSSILPGVKIGRGSVVGIGSIVTKDVDPFSVVAGSPAKLIKKLDPELLIINGIKK
jgi:acetyltransferase-like isoleucine patch superfamily enzyme